jgi:hypothetical protein
MGALLIAGCLSSIPICQLAVCASLTEGFIIWIG